MHTVSYFPLANGLRLATVQRPHLHRAVIAAYVSVGSRHETQATNGISHFLEHMLFRGTRQHPTAARFNHAIESLGGSMNAATHGDYTLYELTVPPDALAEGCATMGEVFTAPVFADIEIEKGIVREEILEDLDDQGVDVNPDNVVRTQVFAGHPLGMPITGSTDNLARFSVAQLRRHLARYYTARNMVVAITAPVSHRAMVRAASRAFGALPVGTRPGVLPFTAAQRRMRFRAVNDAGSQTAVRIGFPAPGSRARQALAIELLMRVLDDGMSTRLHRRICDERGLAYEVDACAELFQDVGIVDVAASVARGSIASVVEEVLSILGDLAIDGPTRLEVEKAHRRFGFDLDALDDDAHALADFYGAAEIMGQRQDPTARRRAMLALTAQDLRRAARQVFDPSRLNVALVGQDSSGLHDEVMNLVRRFRARLRQAETRVVAAPLRAPLARALPRGRRTTLDRTSTGF